MGNSDFFKVIEKAWLIYYVDSHFPLHIKSPKFKYLATFCGRTTPMVSEPGLENPENKFYKDVSDNNHCSNQGRQH